MKNILEEKKTDKPMEENKPRVVIASKLKIVRETIDRYGQVIKRTEQ